MTTGRKITGLPLPETPREAPPEIHGLVEAIEVTLADSDAMEAAQVLGRTFEYLTRYFAGAAGAISQHLGLPGDPSVAADFGEARKQLQDRMEALGDQATDALSKLVRGVFYVGATRKAPTPRRHARLLDLGGIPIRGYRNIDEWIAIEPGTGDLGNESKANRELLRYLPILKEWLTATATYFLDVKQSELRWETPNELHYSFDAEGVTLQVGPIHLPEPLAQLLPRDYKGLSSDTPPPPVPRAAVAPPEPVPVAPPEPAPVEQAPVAVEPEPAEAAPPAAEPISAIPSFEPIAPVTPPPTVEEVEATPPPRPIAAIPDIEPVVMTSSDIGSSIPMFEPIIVAIDEPPASLESPVQAAEPFALPPIEQTPPPVTEPVAPVEDPSAAVEPAAVQVDEPAPPTAPTPPDPSPPPIDPMPVFESISTVVEDSNPFFTPPPQTDVMLSQEATDLTVGDIGDSATEQDDVASIPVFEPISATPVPPGPAEEPASDNPFDAPPPVSPTVPLMAAEPGSALPAVEAETSASPSHPATAAIVTTPVEEAPLTHVDPPAPAVPPASNFVEEEEEDDDVDFDDLPLPDDDLDFVSRSPEPAGSNRPVDPAVFAPLPEFVKGGERVKPVLPFQREEKSVPQINVTLPILYPVVTGPPPEFFDEIPVDADYPEVLQTALTDLNGAIEANDSLLICGQMQRCFDLMIQFFAGIAGAVLLGIDSDYLSDFEIEDGRFDLEVKLELVVAALSALEEYWEGNDAATLIWSVFYDTLLPATDPNSAYLHTRLLGVEGLVPDGFLEFSELCAVVPGQGALTERSACRETAHRYLPILAFWLENATPLFLESEVDFVDEDGGAALSWAASVSGATLDGTSSGFWLEVSPSRWNLPRPELAPVFVVGDAPDVLLPVVDELNASLEKKDFARAGLMVRIGLDFLVQYFAGCAGALWRDTGEMSAQAEELYTPEATLEEKERLLLMSLGSLHANTSVGAALGKLFSKSSLQYRALIRRDIPAGMGPVAEWAGRRDEIGESNLLIYLPLLRSWLGAANPWFAGGEQLFEEPSDDGRLEGVVAFGDSFLEMVDPEYVIRLAPEIMELVAPLIQAEREAEEGTDQRREFTGMLPSMPILTTGPPLLIGHIGRLLEAGDDRRAANAWMGSAFEYLIQYFAGLCVTVLGGKDAPLRKNVMPFFNPKASLREREVLLVEALSNLSESASAGTQTKIKTIFYTEDGKLRPHTRFLGAAGPGSLNEDEMLLSFWCRARHKTGTLTTQEYHWAMSALTSWVDAAKPFFADCEHYAEDPGPDGQEEMVVELAEDYLDMVMPDYAIQIPARGYYEVLYRETDAVASDDAAIFFPDDVRPELLGPKTTELGGMADDSGDMLMGAATVELGGDDFFGGAGAYDSSDLFAGPAKPVVEEKKAIPVDSPYAKKQRTGTVNLGSGPDKPALPATGEAPKEMTEAELAEAENVAGDRRRKKKRAKKAELGNAVLELYKKERLEKARKRAEARARKEEAEPTKLAYKLTYRGLKNSKQLGGRCHFGVIEVSNAGGGELKGTVEPSHPSVKVTPSRFEGNGVRVTYQIDPSDMPSTGRVGISLNTQDERIELRMERLVPTNWWSERSFGQAVALMAAPAVAYGVGLLWLVALLMGPGLENSFNLLLAGKVKLGMGVKIKLWIFSMLAILPGATGVPALVKMIFSRLDFTVQEESRKIMPVMMALPTVIMGMTMYLTPFWKFATPLAQLPSLANRLLFVILTLGLNLLAAALFSTQTTVWWEERSDTTMARRAFLGFWSLTVLLGVVATFVMSIR